MFKLLRNPLYIYILGFTLTFLVYGLEWSDIYPELTLELKIFFAITFTFFIFFGLFIDRLRLIKRTLTQTRVRLITSSFYILLILYGLEFLYERDIPLLTKIMGRSGVSYMEFGLPLLHGVIISYHSFIIAHSFAVYMSRRERKVLIYNVLLYIPALLIINRSIIVFGLMTSLFIYIHYVGKVKFKNKVLLVFLILLGLYLFGLIGNLRSGGEYIYTQSKATEEFMESSIPKEYYWTYLYVASPLANFQNTVNKKTVDDYSFGGFVFYENLPRIISKTLGESLDIEQRELVRVVPWLTVGTTYARSYTYIGWFGPYLLFIFNLLIYLAFIVLLVPRSSNYHMTTIGILSVLVLLNIFSNMLVVTGISFQLAYCVIFAFFENKRFVLKPSGG